MNIVFLILTYKWNIKRENRREEGQVQTIYVPKESGMLKGLKSTRTESQIKNFR